MANSRLFNLPMDKKALLYNLLGIQSVNLSAGYRYEHTDSEYLDVVAACYRVIKLFSAVFEKSGN